MISPLVLERPGRWRFLALLPVALLVFAPLVALLLENHLLENNQSVFAKIDFGLMSSSLFMGSSVALVSLALGLPLGAAAALWRLKFRNLIFISGAIPLLTPPFFSSVSLLNLGWPIAEFYPLVGSIYSFVGIGFSLCFFTAYLEVRSTSVGALYSSYLMGGNRGLFELSLKKAFLPALSAALLAALVCLGDPGPAQILGKKHFAAQILLSFSALYDYALAGQQTLLLLFSALFFVFPLIALIHKKIQAQVLGRDYFAKSLTFELGGFTAPFISGGFLLVAGLNIGVLLFGLMTSSLKANHLRSAFEILLRTFGNTLIYSLGAGVLATLLGFGIAGVVARTSFLRKSTVLATVALFSLPSFGICIGWLLLFAKTPEILDWLFRGRLTVAWVSAIHLFPVGFLLFLKRFSDFSSSQVRSAGISGISVFLFFRKMLIPQMAPTFLVSVTLASLLAAGDASTAMLLRPPGEDSWVVAILTTMANAPEGLISALCLIYLFVTMVCLAALFRISNARGFL